MSVSESPIYKISAGDNFILSAISNAAAGSGFYGMPLLSRSPYTATIGVCAKNLLTKASV